jgi:transglutaminase-like putative cysteine protease/uncharacterized protein (DUF58 family)
MSQGHALSGIASASPHRGRPFGARGLTSIGSWALTAVAFLTTLGLLRGDVWMFLLALLAVAALAVSWAVVPRLPHVTVTLVGPAVETVGRPTRAQLVIRAGAHGVPRHHLAVYSSGDRLTDGRLNGSFALLEAMAAGETRTLELELHPQICGVHDRIATHHQTTAPFALVRRRHVLSHDAQRIVAAGVDTARSEATELRGEGQDGPVTITRSGPEVHALRAWSPGDGTAIHWRTTARRGEPVVVDRESHEHTGLVVVVGPASSAEGEDAVVARAAGLALAAARAGAEVHLVSSRGTESLAAHEADELLRWTAMAGSAPPDAELTAEAAGTAGAGGRVLVVHGPGEPTALWREAAERVGAELVERSVEARPTYAAPEPVRGTFTLPLRVAVLASLAGGLLALVLTGVLGGGAAVAWSLVLAGVWAVGAASPALLEPAVVRTGASTAAVLVSGAIAFRLVGADELAPAVSALLCGIATAQLVTARTRRDGLVALSLGPIMVLTAAGFGPGPSLVVPLVLVTCAFLAGLSDVAASALGDGATPGDQAPPRAQGTVGPITAVVVLGLVAFLILPLGSAPTLGTSLLSGRPRVPSAEELAARRTPAYFGDSMNLDARGRLPDTPAFSVERGGPPLWRAQTHDRVIDGVWSSDPFRATLTTSTGRVVVPADPSDVDGRGGESADYTVRPVRVSMLVAPGPALVVTGPVVLEQQQTNAFVVDSGLEPYVVTAVARDGIDSLSESGSGPDATDPAYTAPDPTTTPRTEELARSIVAGRTDRVARVQAIEAWLRSNVRYQLDAPLPPAGRDAVDFLLFDSRAGFCEHFAAAEAIMLRSLGIPARIATGYAVTDEVVDAQGWSVVRDSDAHAWVEVWIEGHGWVASDPTAGSTLLDPSADDSPLQRLRDAWNRMWSDDAGRRLLAFGLVAAAAIGALIVVLLRRRRPAGGRSSSAHPREATLEPLAAFGRFRAALVLDGHDLAPGDGVAQVRALVADDAELAAALDVIERTLYDRAMPPSQLRLATATLLDARTAELVARRGAAAPV